MPPERRRLQRSSGGPAPADPPPPERSAPQVVAHRGASGERPEHTLAAYELALAQGALALECDVRLTRDAHLVCVHDRTLERTSDGTGPVSAQTLAELRSLDFGSWHGSVPVPCEVLTLERLLELAAGTTGVELAVELKHPTRRGGELELAVARMLAETGTARPRRDGTSPVRLMSFSVAALRRAALLLPAVPRVHLVDGGRLAVAEHRRAVANDPRLDMGPSLALLRRRPDLVASTHARGRRVHVWTVNESQDVAWCRDVGVDIVISDRPGRALRALSAPTPAVLAEPVAQRSSGRGMVA